MFNDLKSWGNLTPEKVMATIVSVMYPTKEGSRFDIGYYLSSHMPMVEEKWRSMGLKRWEVLRGRAAPGGEAPPYQVIANLTFDTAKQFEDDIAMHGERIMQDIPTSARSSRSSRLARSSARSRLPLSHNTC